MSEDKLIDGCLAGKREYQQLLYERYCSKMMYVCYRYCRNREEAEDILQDGFVKVFTQLNKFRRDGSLEGWVRRIMVNTALEFLRKQKSQPEMSQVGAESYDQDVAYDAGALSALSVRELTALIESLPPGYNLVFNLYAIEGYSHKEIAEALNISEGTSKSQLAKARNYLKKLIEKESPDVKTIQQDAE